MAGFRETEQTLVDRINALNEALARLRHFAGYRGVYNRAGDSDGEIAAIKSRAGDGGVDLGDWDGSTSR